MENDISLLLVEDNVLVAHNLKKNLIGLGFNVVNTCHNYEDGLRAIKELDFDLLLSDINLGNPSYTGIDLAITAKKLKSISTIFLTAYADKDTIKTATKVFPAGYLVKPISFPSLYATIHNAIDNHILHKKTTTIDNTTPENLFIYSKVGKTMRKVFWADVYLITVVKNYVILKTIDKHTALIRSSLLNFTEKIIPQEILHDFIQINRSELISKKFADKIEEHQVLIQGEVLTVTSKLNV
jgi:YesN/AraC family two-component response regulator